MYNSFDSSFVPQPDRKELRELIDNSLQYILDFRAKLRLCEAPHYLQDDELYQDLVSTHEEFRQRTNFLLRVLKAAAVRGGQLSALFMQLNFNNYYNSGMDP